MKSSWVTLELAGVEATRLAPGDDLRAALEGLKLGTGGAAILTCVGSLSKTRLRMAGAKDVFLSEEPVEIVSLVGTLSKDGVHLHLSLCLITNRSSDRWAPHARHLGSHDCRNCGSSSWRCKACSSTRLSDRL